MPNFRAKLGNRQTQVPSTTSNLTGTIHPIGNNVVKQLEMKTITKAEERTKLKEIIGGRSHLLGARNMTSLTNPKKIGGKVQSVVRDGSMLEFIKKQPTALKRYPYVPKLGTGLRGDKSVNLVAKAPDGSSTSSQDPARIRAIAILKRRQEATGSASKPLKRKSENKADQESPKRSKLSSIGNLPNLDILLRKKSIHDSESNKAQGIAMQKHLDSLEQTEKVETFASECMAVKNVRIVSCKKCGYTAQKRSELCMREGHYITKGTAEKRFFKCSSCQRRTVAYGIMPTKACKTVGRLV
ncbi:unnamed protein product [Angiostrongylus costaricensis]|uniref:Mcm10 domain-containing protein n=1 Tax=Angiostrongylus costaricensis TaxID=334426 RepID=A0A0R3P9J8_ANGCS|nr:unnamed protein product [Angiostrongylus costaricensis]